MEGTIIACVVTGIVCLTAGILIGQSALRAAKAETVKVSADVTRVVSDVKAWATRESASAKDVLEQVEARMKQIL
jgi:hypothetical protein